MNTILRLACRCAGAIMALAALTVHAEAAERGEIEQLKSLVQSMSERLERLERHSGGKEPAKRAGSATESPRTKAIVRNLVQDNDSFVKERGAEYFKPFLDTQKPRATVVTCSDSRVHTHAMDKTPDGDLFMVRNIGNQVATAEGSVEYGVHHLETPLLIIVGHTVCGAIKAAAGDYSKLSASIKRELDTIRIGKGVEVMEGVKANVHNQVHNAIKKFKHEVDAGTLTVVGAVYDFRNDLGQGYGKLHIVNINGETNPRKVAASPLLEGLASSPASKTLATAPKAKQAASAEHEEH